MSLKSDHQAVNTKAEVVSGGIMLSQVAPFVQ